LRCGHGIRIARAAAPYIGRATHLGPAMSPTLSRYTRWPFGSGHEPNAQPVHAVAEMRAPRHDGALPRSESGDSRLVPDACTFLRAWGQTSMVPSPATSDAPGMRPTRPMNLLRRATSGPRFRRRAVQVASAARGVG
jgi:hypothetical protein